MATITVRTSAFTGEKYYQLNWSEGGVRQRENLGFFSEITAQQADVKLKAKEYELSSGNKVFVGAATFEAHLIDYLAWHAAQYPSSHFRVKGILEAKHMRGFHGPMTKTTAKDIETWKVKRGTQVAPETVAKELRTLKAFYNKALEWEKETRLAKSPAEYVAPPQKLTSRKLRFYAREELVRLYERPLHGNRWKLLANTGLRRGEAHNLRRRHIDLQARELTVESLPTARTKSAKYRIIPLNDSALEALQGIFAAWGATLHPEAYVLPRMAKGSFTRALAIDLKRAGLARIPGSLVHALRHCYGAHMYMGGVELRDLQELMGHADMKTTLIYAKVTAEHLHKVARHVAI
jgi:integrase/recombinase XerC